MSKRLIAILALAFVVGLAFSAYAEVQNVKVSGDLLFRGISRNDFTLCKGDEILNGINGDLKYRVSGLTTTARVRVDADLTDNVSTTVRLLNERSWGIEDIGGQGGGTDVSIDLAYVTLKEFLYSPLTLTVGRQELRFGNALIIGDPDTNQWSEAIYVPQDLSSRKAFDAIRATLNYDPLVVDIIYAKIDEWDAAWFTPASLVTGFTFGPERNDMDLYGVNGKWDLGALGIKGTLDTYMFARFDSAWTQAPVAFQLGKKDECYVLGGLFSAQITDNLTGSLEYAYQFGTIAFDPIGVNVTNTNLSRRAYAIQAGTDLALPIGKKYAPHVGLGWTYLSGDSQDDDTYKYWDPMFEDQTANNITNALFPSSNCQVLTAKASMKPTEDITLMANYGWYRLAAKQGETINTGSFLVSPYSPAGSGYVLTHDKDLGQAFDLTATYDYTEDVQLGLTFGYFNPGEAFEKELKYTATATQVIGSMKVTF